MTDSDLYQADKIKTCFCQIGFHNCAYCVDHRGDYRTAKTQLIGDCKPRYLGMEGRFPKFNYGDKFDFGYDLNQYAKTTLKRLV